jgi:hypothetical protein
MTLAFANAEFALCSSVLTLRLMLAPLVLGFQSGWLTGLAAAQAGLVSSIAYVLAVAFLEPFYVAAGFGLYLNRRVELEAWDIEQEFRRAFAR